MAQGIGYLDVKPLEDWTPSEVDNALSSIGEAFTQYRKVFLDNGVSGNVLLQLDAQDCIELGITKGIHRKAILSFVQELRLKHMGLGQNGRRVSNASMASLASSHASHASHASHVSHHGAYAATAPLPSPYCSNPFEPGASPVPPAGHHPIPPQSPMTPTPTHHSQHTQHAPPSPSPSHHLQYAQGAGYHAAQNGQHVSQSPGAGDGKEMYANPFAQPQMVQVQKPSFGNESAVGDYIAQQRGVPAQPKYFDGPDSPGFLCPPSYHTHTPSIISSASSASERSERSLSSESSAFRSLSGDTTCMSPPPPPPGVGYSLGGSCVPPPPPPYDLSSGDDTPMMRPARLDLHRGGEGNELDDELSHTDDKLMGDIDDFLLSVDRRRGRGRPNNDSSVLVDLPRVREGRRRSISKLATPTKSGHRRSHSHGPRRRTVSSPGPRRRAMSVGPGGRNKNEGTEKSSSSYPQRSHVRAGRAVSLEEGYGARRRCSEESAASTGTSSWDGGSTSSELTESSDDESDDDGFTEPRYVQRIVSGADLESDDDSSDSGVGWLIEKVPRWVLKGK